MHHHNHQCHFYFPADIDASLTLAESFILGILTFVDYRKLDRNSSSSSRSSHAAPSSSNGPDEDNQQDHIPNSSNKRYAAVHL